MRLRKNCSQKVWAIQLLSNSACINQQKQLSFPLGMSSSPGNKLEKSLQMHRGSRRKPRLISGSSSTTSTILLFLSLLIFYCSRYRRASLSIIAQHPLTSPCRDFKFHKLSDDYSIECLFMSLFLVFLGHHCFEFPVIFQTPTDGLCSGI